MIELHDVHKSLAGREVLRGVDLRIETGVALAVLGPSGTGKSVLLKHVIGLLEPDRGDVLVGGRSIAHARYRELASIRSDMSYVFQDGALLDSLSVLENLRFAIDDAECRADFECSLLRVIAALASVNLDERVLDQLPGELSGGMRKRVAVARAIINAPSIILYDEPTTGLDPRNVAAIDELIRATHQRLNATSVIVTHDLRGVANVADQVALLEGGRIRFTGTPDELFQSEDPAVTKFLGHQPLEETWQATRAAATR
ncbi:MAG TPA: ATP-binding cassette domain-containing protein [Longimicrobiales bacterium]|nr:ATP-binding cassette domain-containing protein [Longimicrobiales bacterium]